MNLDKASLVTLGITCHNAIDTIARALRSAIQQDWPQLEILIVDDCSTDGSTDLISSIINSEPRARLIRHTENVGVASARNTILREAHGEFVAYFDDDDVSAADRIKAQVHRLCAYEQQSGGTLCFCYCHRDVVPIGYARATHQADSIGSTPPEPHGPMVADYLLGLNVSSSFAWGNSGAGTLLARREAFLACGGFDPTFRRCAEWDLAIRAAYLGAHFISVDRALVTVYQTMSSDKTHEIALEYTLMLRRKHQAYLKNKRMITLSRLRAYSTYFTEKGSPLTGYALRFLAVAIQPRSVALRVARRLGLHRGDHE